MSKVQSFFLATYSSTCEERGKPREELFSKRELAPSDLGDLSPSELQNTQKLEIHCEEKSQEKKLMMLLENLLLIPQKDEKVSIFSHTEGPLKR